MYEKMRPASASATVLHIFNRAISSLFLWIINDAPLTYPAYNVFDFSDSCFACTNCFPNIIDSPESVAICSPCVCNSVLKLAVSCDACVDCSSSSADRVSSLNSSLSEIGRYRS